MLHSSVSIDEVIARIIRNTRVSDSSYLLDFLEWIPEAMGQMKTNQATVAMYKDLEVIFHKAKLPCGEIFIDAVQYGCHRLPYSSTVKHYATGHNLGHSSDSTKVFTSLVEAVPNTANLENIFWSSTQEAVSNCPINGYEWYAIEMGWLTTSIQNGKVRIYFRSQPLDANGLPLIPDNENYKQAIYWYVRAMMVGSGFKDTVYSIKDLQANFELYARRAINEISYPTPDEKEQQVKTQVRFLPPANYWENFFRVDNHEQIFTP